MLPFTHRASITLLNILKAQQLLAFEEVSTRTPPKYTSLPPGNASALNQHSIVQEDACKCNASLFGIDVLRKSSLPSKLRAPP